MAQNGEAGVITEAMKCSALIAGYESGPGKGVPRRFSMFADIAENDLYDEIGQFSYRGKPKSRLLAASTYATASSGSSSLSETNRSAAASTSFT